MICEHCGSAALPTTMRDLGDLGAASLCLGCWMALLQAVTVHSWGVLRAHEHNDVARQVPRLGWSVELGVVEGHITAETWDPLRGLPLEGACS